jgi:hypothetical protein
MVTAPLASRTFCSAGRAAAGMVNVAATKLTAFSAHCAQKSIVVPASRTAPSALGAGMIVLQELHWVWVIWMFIVSPFSNFQLARGVKHAANLQHSLKIP